MPGLSLGAGAQVRARGGYANGDNPTPVTATQAAFGTEAAPASSTSALAPTHAAGLTFWVGVAGVAFMVFLYWSLPS